MADQGLTDPSGENPNLPGEPAFEADQPLDGTYVVQVIGTGSGPYTLDFLGISASGATVSTTLSGTASPGSIDTYTVEFTAASGGSITFTPTQASTSLSVAAASGTFGGSATLSATLTSSGAGVSGKSVDFTLNGASIGSAVTDNSGVATLSNVSLAGINAGAYTSGVGSSFAGDSSYAASNDAASLTVSKATTAIVVSATSAQYSDSSMLSATVSPMSLGGQTLTGNVQFSVNGTNVGSLVAIDSAGTACLSCTISQAEGSYPVAASFASANTNFGNSSGTATLAVTREDAVVALSAANPISVKVNTAGGTAGPITLTATITEVPDGSPGDISKAVPMTYTLQPVGAGSPIICTATTSGGGIDGSLTASCTFNSVPVNVFDVHVAVGGSYYTGAGDGNAGRL